MARKRYAAEEIVNTLREAVVLIAKGTTIVSMCPTLPDCPEETPS